MKTISKYFCFVIIGYLLTACGISPNPVSPQKQEVEAENPEVENPEPISEAISRESFFATYFGQKGEGDDQLRSTVLDAEGNLYFAGGVYLAASIPGCVGNNGGDMDAVIGRFNIEGKLDWCRYLGGRGYDRFYDIEINSDGTQVVMAGRAGAGFPVTKGSWDTTFDNTQKFDGGPYKAQDAAVCAINTIDGAIAWCTYTGFDKGPDFIRTIALDANNDIILGTGYDGKVEDPKYTALFLNSPSGGQDGIVGKLSADGKALLWYRYIGGKGDNAIEGMVAVDSLGIYYTPAWTKDSTHTIVGGFDSTYAGNNRSDLYLVRLSLNGEKIVYSTYIGGTGEDNVGMYGVMPSDTPGIIYVKGSTDSIDYPTTSGTISVSRNGPSDCGIVKIDTRKTGAASLIAGTYIGGSRKDYCEGAVPMANGGIALSGSTNSIDFPVTSDAHQSLNGGGYDGWMGIVSPDLRTIVYGTYFGGAKNDSVRALDIDSKSIIGVGQTNSKDLPVSDNAYQSKFSGGRFDDGMILKLPR